VLKLKSTINPVSPDQQKAIRNSVEDALEKYRLYKYLTFEEREAATTQSYQERYHGPTNVTSDQTGDIAAYNVDGRANRKTFCDRVELAVSRLAGPERTLIEKRYLTQDAEYITDQHVYNFEFEYPMSPRKYGEIRWRACNKLYHALGLQKQPTGELEAIGT
jgi:ArpU family phage transcriptional regulator